MKQKMVKIGRKLYFIVDRFGGEIAVTRKKAREIKRVMEGSVLLEIPLSQGQQKSLQDMMLEGV